MTRDEALQILGLQETASEDQVRMRFKELARDLHPDKGGDPLAMAQLYTARELALGHANSLALVPIDDIRSLVAKEISAVASRYESQVSAVASRYESQERREQLKRSMKQHHTAQSRLTKNSGGTLLLLAGAFAIFKSDLLPLLRQEAHPLLNMMLISCVVVGGLFFVVASWWIERLKREVDDFSDALNDKTLYLFLLDLVINLSGREGTFWSEDELETLVVRWNKVDDRHYRPIGRLYAFLSARVGDFSDSEPYRWAIITARRFLPRELAQMLVARGVETQLLEEKEEFGADEGFVRRYRLMVPDGWTSDTIRRKYHRKRELERIS